MTKIHKTQRKTKTVQKTVPKIVQNIQKAKNSTKIVQTPYNTKEKYK